MRYGARKIAVIGSFVLGTSLFLLSYSFNLYMLIAMYGIAGKCLTQ